MTNQSHTELAARARDWAVHLEQANVGRTDQYIAHTLRRCAAALESPERGQGDNYVAWLRYDDHGGNRPTTIHLCDSDAPGAFKVWRHPDAEVQRLQQKIDAMAREAWSWSKACETESTKLYAVKKAISDAYGIVSKDLPWTPEHSKNYPKQASEIINAALTIFSATPSPQAEKQPLSETEIEVMWGEFMSAKGSGYVPDFVRAIEAAHGIVTKESST